MAQHAEELGLRQSLWQMHSWSCLLPDSFSSRIPPQVGTSLWSSSWSSSFTFHPSRGKVIGSLCSCCWCCCWRQRHGGRFHFFGSAGHAGPQGYLYLFLRVPIGPSFMTACPRRSGCGMLLSSLVFCLWPQAQGDGGFSDPLAIHYSFLQWHAPLCVLLFLHSS